MVNIHRFYTINYTPILGVLELMIVNFENHILKIFLLKDSLCCKISSSILANNLCYTRPEFRIMVPWQLIAVLENSTKVLCEGKFLLSWKDKWNILKWIGIRTFFRKKSVKLGSKVLDFYSSSITCTLSNLNYLGLTFFFFFPYNRYI